MGQNATTGAAKYGLSRRPLEDRAFKAFENAARMTGSERNNNYKLVINTATSYVIPKKALQHPKRDIWRFIKNPFSVKVKYFVERVITMNGLLTLFPDPSSTLAATKILIC